MAPAACDTIARNLQDFHRKPSDYDAIFTGDLGMVGQTILFDLLTEKGFDISSVHQDCGMLIYDPQTQDTHSGGSVPPLFWQAIFFRVLYKKNGKGFSLFPQVPFCQR